MMIHSIAHCTKPASLTRRKVKVVIGCVVDQRCQQGLDEEYLISSTNSDDDNDSILASSSCSVHFHVGPAGDFADILSKANILFC